MHSFLVVSKDNSVHNFIKNSLNRECLIHTAKTSEEALQIFIKRDIDVVFLDIILSDEERNKLFENLWQLNIEPTIIALVPEAQPILSEEALRFGAYELLEKPLRKEALQQASNRALERQELKRELGFIQSQLKNLKSVSKDNSLSNELVFNKQPHGTDLRLTYKEVFQKFSKALAHVYDLEKLVDLTVEAMAEIFKVGKVVFMLVDKEGGFCRPYRCLGLDEVITRDICFSNNQGAILWLTKNHQILNKDVIDREVEANRLTERKAINIQKEMNLLQVQLCIPIFAKGSLIGVVALGNKITGKVYFDEDMELLSMLAGYIGIAVENALLYQEVNLGKIHNENVLENIPCGVIAINNDCKVNTFNKSAANMLNICPHDVLEKDVKNIGSVFANIILRTLKDKKTYKMSEIMHPVTCSTYAVSTSLLLDKDKELGAIMVFSDLTEIKKLESRVKDLERQEFYNMLSKNMAHCVKNHLVAVKTFMDLFPERLEDKEFIGQFYHVARKEVGMLDLMIKKLTILGENNGLMKRKVDLRISFDQVLESYKEKMAEFNISLIKKYSEESATTYGDCEKLEEAFSNIMLNAIEAMPDGGTLTVKLSNILLDDKKLKEISNYLMNGEFSSKYHGTNMLKKLPLKYIEILVEDTGSGIPQEKLKNVFLPFYTTKLYNVGLGLSIAQRIIKEHDGFIFVSSKEKEGSKFHVLIPISDAL